ncbi:exopolysaccharide production protein ExoZ [Vibrio crassostreae]|nr:exopolysaccharide production protein ExoZ [Vibrio crassostreae]
MSSPKNFHLLDLSRFIAAMAVLFWHYQHFYMIEGVSFIRQEQPFYNVFSLLYNYGNIAVQYFWVLSGFVFFFTYSKKISLGKTLPSDYIKNRIARLYPLHILTLIITTVVAYYFNEKNGYYFVYSFNDLKHFILNVFLISHWGLQDGWSYNAPIWSVSVEIFSYIVFYLYCKFIKLDSIQLIVTLALITALNSYIKSDLLNCLYYFFIGGLTYHVYNLILSCRKDRLKIITLTLLGFALASTSPYGLEFALLTLFLALLQSHNVDYGKKYKNLGDLSFGMYLWHYPIQLFFVCFVSQEYDFYQSKITIITFVTITIISSAISFKYYEKPAKIKIRNSFR